MPKSFRSLKQYVYAGTLLALPAGVTIWIVLGIVDFFDRMVLLMLPDSARCYDMFCRLPGYGILVTFLILLMLGYVMHTVVGAKVMQWGERMMVRMPVVGAIYKTSRKIAHAVAGSQSADLHRVALLEYPHKGTWCMCFVTGDAPPAAHHELSKDEKWVSVFIPTAPNPTSGVLLIVPTSQLIMLNMPADEGMRFVVSAGINESEGV